MLRKIVAALVLAYMCFGNAYAKDDYLYKNTCPADQGIDKWNFYKCNCTSFAAFALNEYGISFNNSYRQTVNNCWGDAGNWVNAALRAGIAVDNFPMPGDIVYWKNMGDYGHVAEVAIVNYNSGMTAWNKVFIRQYNGKGNHKYSEKWIYPSDNPSGFIHILAYEEGVNSLYYLNCFEMSGLCDGQTHEEWDMIAKKVWNNYRCKENCHDSKYNPKQISTIANALAGMGGGPGYQTTPVPDDTQNENQTLPDFVIQKLILADSNGNERYRFYKNEEVKMRAQLKNIGDGGINSDDDIETRYYLSKGYKEDPHSDWIRVGRDNTKGRNLEPGETHWEEEGLKLWNQDIVQEGKTYNIVVCVDRTKDDHNGDGDYPEIRESNNCSTEAVFEVLKSNPQPPTDNNQPSNYANSPCGKAGFTKQKCIQIIMTLISNLNK